MCRRRRFSPRTMSTVSSGSALERRTLRRASVKRNQTHVLRCAQPDLGGLLLRDMGDQLAGATEKKSRPRMKLRQCRHLAALTGVRFSGGSFPRRVRV